MRSTVLGRNILVGGCLWHCAVTTAANRLVIGLEDVGFLHPSKSFASQAHFVTQMYDAETQSWRPQLSCKLTEDSFVEELTDFWRECQLRTLQTFEGDEFFVFSKKYFLIPTTVESFG